MKTADQDIGLDGTDVSIEWIEPVMCDCGEGEETHRVTLDLRANGRVVDVFRGCEECAQEFALYLAASLRVPVAHDAIDGTQEPARDTARKDDEMIGYDQGDTYPAWMTRALDSIAEKADDEPLTNTETEALLRYDHGDEWFESDNNGRVA